MYLRRSTFTRGLIAATGVFFRTGFACPWDAEQLSRAVVLSHLGAVGTAVSERNGQSLAFRRLAHPEVRSTRSSRLPRVTAATRPNV